MTSTTNPPATTSRPTPAPERAFAPPVRLLGGLGVGGVALFGAAVLVMHYLEPGLTPHDHFVSEYSLTDTGLLMKAAFIALGVGVGCLALGLRRAFPPGRRVRWAWGLLLTAALAFAASGVVDSDPIEVVTAGGDPSVHGMLHDLAGAVAFLTTIAGAFVLRGVFRRDARWRDLAGIAGWFGAALLTLLVLLLGAPADVVGVAQRPFLVVLLLWFGVLGCWMRRRATAPEPLEGVAGDPHVGRPRLLGWVGVLGATLFAGAVVIVGLLEPDLSLASNFVSDFALGDGGLVLTGGFLAIGASQVAAGLGLRGSLRPSRRRTYASWALVVVGASAVVSGLFPSLLWTDPASGEPAWHGAVHEAAGLLSFPVVVSMLVVLRGAYARDARWRALAGTQMMFTVVFVVLLVAFMGVPEASIGVAQRTHQAVVVTWLSMTSLFIVATAASGVRLRRSLRAARR